MIAASIDYIEPWMAERMGYAKAMAMLALVVFGCAAAAVAVGREKHGVTFGA